MDDSSEEEASSEQMMIDVEYILPVADTSSVSDNDDESYQPVATDFEETSDEEYDDCCRRLIIKEARGRPKGWRKNKGCEDDLSEKSRVKKSCIPPNLLCSMMCCSLMCLVDVPLIVMTAMRHAFTELTQIGKALYVRNWLRDHRSNNITRFIVGNKDVCLVAWAAVIGLPLSSFYSIRKKFKEGVPIRSAGRQKGCLTSQGVFAMVWLEMFASKHGDKLPDQLGFHLPCCLSKSSIYVYYKEEASDGAVSMTQFFRIWRQLLPHVKIPKTTRFSICDTCVKIARRLEQCHSKSEKQVLHQYREMHLQQQTMERKKYYKHISKAKTAPAKYLSIIIDGMDQDKTSVPHLLTIPKSLANLFMLRINLTGVICHGIGSYGFFDPFRWGHGSSYTISVLVHVLSMLTMLPPTLYLQLDNCPGANKNRFLLGFLAALVEGEVFRKVKVSFLMVGHTHEDIDQLFSRFSVWLRKNEVFTMDELLCGFENCFKPKPTALMTNMVYNIQEWLSINPLKNHSKPHVFRIKKINGMTTISFKKWSTDKIWQTVQGTLLTENMDINRGVYEIKPDSSRIDEKVQQDIGTLTRFLKRSDLSLSWEQFFNNLREDDLIEREEGHQIIPDLKTKSNQSTQEDITEQAEVLDGFDTINDPIPQVMIGSKRTKGRSVPRPVTEQSSSKVQQISVTKGNVIAVYTDDIDNNYYILKVTKPQRTLLRPINDDWGNHFDTGSQVIEGLYYDRCGKKELQYSLIPGQRAIVFKESVIHKVHEHASDLIVISPEENLKILSLCQ